MSACIFKKHTSIQPSLNSNHIKRGCGTLLLRLHHDTLCTSSFVNGVIFSHNGLYAKRKCGRKYVNHQDSHHVHCNFVMHKCKLHWFNLLWICCWHVTKHARHFSSVAKASIEQFSSAAPPKHPNSFAVLTNSLATEVFWFKSVGTQTHLNDRNITHCSLSHRTSLHSYPLHHTGMMFEYSGPCEDIWTGQMPYMLNKQIKTCVQNYSDTRWQIILEKSYL